MSHKPDPNKNVNLTIDGIPVTVPEGTRILEAAKKVNIKIPVLCEHPELCKRAICRICVVECDGRGKLLAACANDVWEGVNIVTNSVRLLDIRKTIIELILANHPQDCLSCVRSKNCELQSLAADFGICKQPFERKEMKCKPPLHEGNVLVRDMDKCVKCGRCVEVCQEIQTIRSINTSHRSVNYEINTPYSQPLIDSACVLCGHCATVCPVGAIYEHDESARVLEMLNKEKLHKVVQIDPALCTVFDKQFELPAGTVTPGKIATALKQLGFDKVFDAKFSGRLSVKEEIDELLTRQKNNNGKLPLISGCSPNVIKFAGINYPDLKEHFSQCTDAHGIIDKLARSKYSEISGIDPAAIAAVTVTPCISGKFRLSDTGKDASGELCSFVLSINEIISLFRKKGVILNNLTESPFDDVTGLFDDTDSISVKTLTVHGYANARTVLDSVRRGECDADLVKIMNCPDGFKYTDCCAFPDF